MQKVQRRTEYDPARMANDVSRSQRKHSRCLRSVRRKPKAHRRSSGALAELLCDRTAPIRVKGVRRPNRGDDKSKRSGMIEDRRAERVHTRDRLFDGTGKAFFSDLRNSLVDLVTGHLALCLVADAGAAHTRFNKSLNHLRRKECGEDSTS